MELSGAGFALEGKENVAEVAQRAMGADLGRADGAFEDAGDLGK